MQNSKIDNRVNRLILLVIASLMTFAVPSADAQGPLRRVAQRFRSRTRVAYVQPQSKQATVQYQTVQPQTVQYETYPTSQSYQTYEVPQTQPVVTYSTDAVSFPNGEIASQQYFSSQPVASGASYITGGCPDAQRIADAKARAGSNIRGCRHVRSDLGFGCGRYEGCGVGPTRESALLNCCYSGAGSRSSTPYPRRPIIAKAAHQKANGSWYAVKIYREFKDRNERAMYQQPGFVEPQ